MNDKPSSENLKSEPVQDATPASENDAQPQPEASGPPVTEPDKSVAEQPDPAQSEEETDRKQDESIASLAKQTDWIAKQTQWARYQAIASTILGAITLAVLVYHGMIMGKQSQAMTDQTAIMKGQLDSMNSDSAQTREMIAALQKQADASSAQAKTSEALAEQNEGLIDATLAQADAAKAQAQTAQQAFYIGDRPYISANAVLDKFETGTAPTIMVMFENNGRTPAIDFLISAMVAVNNLPKPDLASIATPEVMAENRKQLPYSDISEGGAKSFLGSGGKTMAEIKGPELSAKLFEDIKAKKQFLFVWGIAPYKDGLRRVHILRYCLFYNPEADQFVTCPTFNSTS